MNNLKSVDIDTGQSQSSDQSNQSVMSRVSGMITLGVVGALLMTLRARRAHSHSDNLDAVQLLNENGSDLGSDSIRRTA